MSLIGSVLRLENICRGTTSVVWSLSRLQRRSAVPEAVLAGTSCQAVQRVALEMWQLPGLVGRMLGAGYAS